MPKPSVVIPQWMLDEIDDRRHSRTDRSEWIRQAIVARLNAEDSEEWTTPQDWSESEERENDQENPSTTNEVSAGSGG